MALRFSTGLRDALQEKKAQVNNAITATTVSFGDGTGSGGRDQILDSGNGLAGFHKYDKITVEGSTSNDGTYEILSVAAGVVAVAAGSLTTEAAGNQVILASARGGSMCDLFRHGVLDIRSGTQPASADDAESGSSLCLITLSSGAFTAGVDTNGLNINDAVAGVIGKYTGEVWSGQGLAAATAGWFRFYDNSKTTGASTTAVRFDGAIGTSGRELNMSNTTISVGGTTTIDTVALTLPAYA